MDKSIHGYEIVARGIEHPAPHQRGTYGDLARTPAGVYVLLVGGVIMSFPQREGARIDHDTANRS